VRWVNRSLCATATATTCVTDLLLRDAKSDEGPEDENIDDTNINGSDKADEFTVAGGRGLQPPATQTDLDLVIVATTTACNRVGSWFFSSASSLFSRRRVLLTLCFLFRAIFIIVFLF